MNNCISIFIQPFHEGIHRFKEIRQKNLPFKAVAKNLSLGICLLIPFVNIVVFQILKLLAIRNNRQESFIQQKTTRSIYFVQNDVEKLAKAKGYFGLRHTSSPEDQEEEARKGFSSGCSLNISPQESALNAMSKRSWKHIKLEEHQQFLKCFESGVDDFIYESINFDLRKYGRLIHINSTKLRDVAVIVDKCRFAIVNYAYATVCDHERWGQGLGRHPKQFVPGNKITPITPVKVEDLGYTNEQLDQVITTRVQGDELFNRLHSHYMNALITTLRAHLQTS